MKRNLILIGCILILATFVNAHTFSDKAINWGLGGYGNEKIPSIPPGAREILDVNNGIYVGPNEKKVYLTFDLGYEAGYTGAVLDILKKHNIRAIFFLCGNYLKEEALVNRMINEGHVIGNHTDHHRDLPTLGDDAIKKDIVDFTTKFNEKFNSPIVHFRPPKGRLNESVLKIANDQGLKTVMWTLAIEDWGRTPINVEKSTKKIMSRIHPGAIMLFHISNSGMPNMLDVLIPQIIEKGYSVGDATVL